MNNKVTSYLLLTSRIRIAVLDIVLALLLVLFSHPLFAEKTPDLLVLNSDYSINKYALMQEVFLKNQNKTSVTLNLAEQTDEQVSDVLRRNKFKIIYCIGTKAYLLAHRLAPEKIIVFSSVINWRRLPESDLSYGIAQELPAAMQLTMYRYLFPEIKTIGVLYSQQFNKQWLPTAKQAAEEVGIEIISKNISADQNVSLAVEELLPEVDALWLISDPLVLTDKTTILKIFKQAANRKKPIFSYSKIFIKFGAQLVISTDIPTIGRQVSALVNSLRHNKTKSKRIGRPVGSHIILNMNKLKGYPIKLNKEALGSVNQIIE